MITVDTEIQQQKQLRCTNSHSNVKLTNNKHSYNKWQASFMCAMHCKLRFRLRMRPKYWPQWQRWKMNFMLSVTSAWNYTQLHFC